jgi:hypothetical protein
MRRTLTITQRLQRVLRVTVVVAVAALCPLYATALFVVPLTLNQQQWQEESGLGVLVMWGMGGVFTFGGWLIVKSLMRERKQWQERARVLARRRPVPPRHEIRERCSRPAATRDASEAATVARVLYIVGRDQPELLAFLRRDFAAEEAEGVIEIVLNRRQGAQSCEADGRDPRRNGGVTVDLREMGFALVRRQAPLP